MRYGCIHGAAVRGPRIGGTRPVETLEQRQARTAAARAAQQAKAKPCGTAAAYRRHRRNGEPAGADCLAAHAAEARKRRKAKTR